ncbi:pilus assembly protein TadG-related protein [Sphingomonas sp. PL-96]|uniref:pilus assembly protein TadG-related protein n=1 Tax=Sphingomonas sp. PL-96 TaxID=2887201 RepID=UPI00226C92E5|nr:pilus assembly protein TadG-related protein [Sphingomonas sp. PL-96]MCC2976713.1 pilus assembly protein TadG-related protein [Sphingomonas sp. PL-96]
MAAAMIPLIGMIGGAIDLSRMYIVKTRLQHACDAGALAGRKAMGGGTWTQSSGAPGKAAKQFFDANISKTAYGAAVADGVFRENAGKVTGTASATVPMTLMRVFGFTSRTLSVTCDAEMRLPNTDVMFVLDTTGSMSQSIGSVTKIDALRVAVKCFYEIVARLDTDAQCTTGTPSGGTGDQVQIRFGFVPYAVNVNVGRLLKPEWMVDKWTYQSRVYIPPSYGAWGNWGAALKILSCGALPPNTDTVEYRANLNVLGLVCIVETRSRTVQPASWEYRPVEHNVSGLKNGSGWNASVQLPLDNGGAARSVSWPGCIEERQTIQTSTFTSITSSAYDLDIDKVPTADVTTRWKPWLPGALYTRQSTGRNDTGNWNRATIRTTTDYSNNAYAACPTAARKLQGWDNADVFDDYVDSLRPEGNTYHDIGLLWGARLMSATGIFANENARTLQGGDIERHLIFMTDGDTQAAPTDYNAYGIPWFDRRQTLDTVVPTADMLEAQINARFAALCTAVKKKNITLWVISFGSMTNETKTRLETCATTGRYFSANDAASLQSTFKSIADQISQLRLTK